jgi:hypothetical protein
MSASRAANQFNAAASNLPPSTDLDGLAESKLTILQSAFRIPQLMGLPDRFREREGAY